MSQNANRIVGFCFQSWDSLFKGPFSYLQHNYWTSRLKNSVIMCSLMQFENEIALWSYIVFCDAQPVWSETAQPAQIKLPNT